MTYYYVLKKALSFVGEKGPLLMDWSRDCQKSQTRGLVEI